MNITSELEKLVSLRDRGDLSQAEFEEAKTLLLSGNSSEAKPPLTTPVVVGSPALGVPGLGLAAGVFVGNLLVISIASGDVAKGFAVGAIAAVLVLVFSMVARALKPQ